MTAGGGLPTMTMTIESERFGQIEVPDEAVLEFPSGLIGIEGTRYTLLPAGDQSPFLWLHSLDDPAFALPVMSPWPLFTDYAVEISDEEATRIGITDAESTSVYVTVRASEDRAQCSANLRAPILVSAGRGFQVINEASPAPVRAPLFPEGEMQDLPAITPNAA